VYEGLGRQSLYSPLSFGVPGNTLGKYYGNKGNIFVNRNSTDSIKGGNPANKFLDGMFCLGQKLLSIMYSA